MYHRTMSKEKAKFKKPACAPRRFKSAFMFYSARRHREIRAQLADQKLRAADIAKMVSKSWKELDAASREAYEEMARADKVRYNKEKAAYKGPWKVLQIKHKDRPKKPMSAFLAFGNERRKAIAEANPSMSNAEISSLLSRLWAECPPHVKQAYRDREARERKSFKRYRAEWELMKQREVGMDAELGRIEGNMVAPQLSLDDDKLAAVAKRDSSSSDSLGNLDDLDIDWLSSEDDISSADAAIPAIGTETPSEGAMYGKGSALSSGAPRKQTLLIGEHTLEALLNNEELFEDFSPLDSPLTAPFVHFSQLMTSPDSLLTGIISE